MANTYGPENKIYILKDNHTNSFKFNEKDVINF